MAIPKEVTVDGLSVLGVEGPSQDGSIQHGTVVLSYAGTSDESDTWNLMLRLSPNSETVLKAFKPGDEWDIVLTKRAKR